MPYQRYIPLIDDQWEFGIDSKKLMNTIWDSLFELGDLKVGSFVKKAGSTLKKEETLPDLAFELSFTALLNACKRISTEYFQTEIDQATELVSKSEKLRWDTRKNLEDLHAVIDIAFFEYPAAWPFLQVFKYQYQHFLMDALNVDPISAQLRSDQLPEKFWLGLIAEWDRNTPKYAPLNAFFKSNPFAANISIFEKRQKYYQRISRFYHQPVLNDERIQLSDIYIEPGFKVHRRNLPKAEYHSDKDGFVTMEFEGKTIHDYINKFFLKGESAFKELNCEQSRLLLLLGQPGQGKSSFTFRVIHDCLNHWGQNKDIAFVKLNRLADPRQFVKTPFDQLQAHFSKEEFDLNSGLLILDGLDELYMTEGLTKSEINDFFLILSRMIKEREGLYVIVTSRFHYVELSNIPKDDAIIAALEPLNLDQQIGWLEKYSHYFPDTKLNVDDLREIDNQKESTLKALWELVNQPILLQLIAKADFSVKEVSNRGEIYRQLFDTLIQRSWASKEGQLNKFEIDPDEFRRFLRALAHRIYQSDREFITLKELEEWQSQTQDFIDSSFKVKHKDLGEALKDVLITFYFRSVEDEDERAKYDEDRRSYAIEFYHKSLQEYLAMEHIWFKVKEDLTEKTTRDKFVITDWKAALELIWNVTTPNGLTQETSAYLREIIKNDESLAEKTILLERLAYFMPEFFQRQFIFKYDIDSKHHYPIYLGLQCFYVGWTIYRYCFAGEIFIAEEWKKSYSQLLSFHQYYRYDYFDFSRVNFNCSAIAFTNLHNLNLNKADLSGAIIELSYFNGCQMKECILKNAALIDTCFDGSDLSYADLSYAYLAGSSLKNVNLTGANLEKIHEFTLQQITSVSTLYDVKNLDSHVRQAIIDKGFGHLFDPPKPDEPEAEAVPQR